MSCEVDLDTFWKQAFAAMAAAAVQDGPTGFGLHTGAETELLLARALGRLISAFHNLKSGGEMLRAKIKASTQKDLPHTQSPHRSRLEVVPRS